MSVTAGQTDIKLPRVAITFCTQCKWMLRAAYFGQELLSTFGTTIGEIALIPATGGIFQVELTYAKSTETAADGADGADRADAGQHLRVLIWDRKTEGGFPETKILKQLVRNHIDPKKELGHSDSASKHKQTAAAITADNPLLQQAHVSEPAEDVAASAPGGECTTCA